MISKPRTLYSCNACGSEVLRWEGRCPQCGSWDTLVEVVREVGNSRRRNKEAVQELATVTADMVRLPLPFPEVTRVLGGGLVPGSVTLLGGEPGIGKSTLLLQIADALTQIGERVAYVTGEESPQQIRLRAQRLDISGRGVHLVSETDVEAILRHLDAIRPCLVVIDSIQTLALGGISSTPGSLVQVRECASLVSAWAKERGVPAILAGHVTKDGVVAGPRVLEHGVDLVLYLEGDASGAYRILRGVKNRFGPSNEVAILEMGEGGLREVVDPSGAFLEERAAGAVGSAVTPILEGTRPLVVELQALASFTTSPSPRRTATGLDMGRLLLVTAVLSRRLGLPLASQDIIASVVGGLRISEPAADLAMALAVVSSLRDRPLEEDLAVVGEVGLSGEIRRVSQLERRLSEAVRLGFRRMLVPASGSAGLHSPEGIEPIPVGSVYEAIERALAMPNISMV